MPSLKKHKQKKRGGKQKQQRRKKKTIDSREATDEGTAVVQGSQPPQTLSMEEEENATQISPPFDMNSSSHESSGNSTNNITAHTSVPFAAVANLSLDDSKEYVVDQQELKQENNGLAYSAEESKATTQKAGNNNSNSDQSEVSVKFSSQNFKKYPKPPTRPSCPICFLTLPISENGSVYKVCCGKVICNGCLCQNALAMESRGQEQSCPFCRKPPPTDMKSYVKQLTRRAEEFNDPTAMFLLSVCYHDGVQGFAKNPRKEVELLRQAVSLGDQTAAFNLGMHYCGGYPEGGIENNLDTYKAYLEVSAYRGGRVQAWHHLAGYYGAKKRDVEAATYHFLVAASYGNDASLDMVKHGFKCGVVTKEALASALRAWQESKDDMKSECREKVKDICPEIHDWV